MYKIRIEHQFAVRWYSADSYTDAMELFHLLTRACNFVQVYDKELICEYRLDWADKAEAHQHETPLCN